MAKAKTVYGHAKELVAEKGKEEAIKEFESMIAELGFEPWKTEKLYRWSALRTALDAIEDDFDSAKMQLRWDKENNAP